MRFGIAILFVLAASPEIHAASAPVPVGAEFQVNSYTTDSQNYPRVSSSADAQFVVVWESRYSGTDDFYSIQGQQFAADGSAQGAQFEVNSDTTGMQRTPSVSLDADGDFVVVWGSHGSSGGDSSGSSIQGRRFSSAGTAQGVQFQVNAYTAGDQDSPAVSLDVDGDFVVVWDSRSLYPDLSSSIQGQRYAAGGAALGGELQISTATTLRGLFPGIALDADGDFAVVWQNMGDWGIQGRRFAAGGSALGGEFRVNSHTSILGYFALSPAVALQADGDFVVVWGSVGSGGGDSSAASIQGQRFSSGGPALGGEFQVNTYTTNAQTGAEVSLDADGDFVVVWDSIGSNGSDSSDRSIQGQRYDSGGATLGPQFQVNSSTSYMQVNPAVSVQEDGDFVVVWQSQSSSGTDNSSTSIQGQRFRVTGDLQGKVFFDRDFDGVADDGEPGIGGVPVELYDDQLTLRRTTVTDPGGIYSLRPKEGSWHLRFGRPSNYSFTARDAGDDSVDSDADPISGETDPFGIQIDVLESSIAAGLTNGIGDKVWNDVDRDGIRDGGELGLAGVTVHLRDKGGNEVGVTTTDAAGRYHFNTLQPGEYYVDFTAPSGYAFAPANQGGSDETDSDADEVTGNSPLFTFSLAEVDTSIDAGLYQLSSIGGLVWDDLDSDGLRESGEPRINGLLVRLLDITGTTVLASQATYGGGAYAFEALASGTYYVEIVPLGAIDLSPKDVGGDDTIDSDFDPATARTSQIAFTSPGVVAHVDAGLRVVVLFVGNFEDGDLSRWVVVQP